MTHIEELASASRAVAATRSRKQKQARLAEVLRGLREDEIAIGVGYLAGQVPQGRIGLGWAAFRDLQPGPPATSSTLSVLDVDRALSALAAISGAGSKARRRETLGALFAKATYEEREFLTQLVLGGLRQGANVGVMVEAVAAATQIDASKVRRAAMLAGAIHEVAAAALLEGEPALSRFALTVFTPVLPMLASPADDVEAALARLGEASFELKLDGVRVQVHKRGDEVRVFSRKLHDLTDAVPEIVEAARALPFDEAIFDGEAIALQADGSPHSFQTTMRRFGRRLDVAKMRASLPLSHYHFDVLHLDGQCLIDAPASERHRAIDEAVPKAHRIERFVTDDVATAQRHFGEVVREGHEGLMAKSLDGLYEAGSRGHSWLKLKPVHTLDLVVLAVEQGSGRRKQWLSNVHLGARKPDGGGFVMLGKTFKGMTDAMLEWQTQHFTSISIGRDGHVVYVRPETVVEIAFSDVQESPHYPGGLALRFARVKRYRSDKSAADAATIDEVREIHQHGHRAR